MARISLGTGGPRDFTSLGQSLALVPRVRMLLSELSAPLVKSLVAEIDELADVRGDIAQTLVDEAPALARDGGMVRDGVDAELDELRSISRGGKTAIAAMEEAERQRTGINSLKVRYNRVFGYYIEISKSNLDAVPNDYIRKQTVVGGDVDGRLARCPGQSRGGHGGQCLGQRDVTRRHGRPHGLLQKGQGASR